MNSEKEKIDKIKQLRLFHHIQNDIENKLFNYLKYGNKISIIEEIIIETILEKTNIQPNINIKYDKKTYDITVKMQNIGLRINITNGDYEI